MHEPKHFSQAPFRFWEYVFFSGAIGAVALYPYAGQFVTPVFSDTTLTLLFAANAAFAYATAALFAKFSGAGHGKWAVSAGVALGAFILTLGQASLYTSPAFAVWSVDAALAVCAFGYLLAAHLLRRAERDFMQHAGHVILSGFGANAALLLLAALAALIPPSFAALAACAIFLALLLT